MSHAPAIDGPDNDGHTMRRNFFKELCKRDKEVNEDGRPNVFTIEQIWRKSISNFTLDDVCKGIFNGRRTASRVCWSH